MSMEVRASRCAVVFKALMLGLEITIAGHVYRMDAQFNIAQRAHAIYGDNVAVHWMRYPSSTRHLVLLCEAMSDVEFAAIAANVALNTTQKGQE